MSRRRFSDDDLQSLCRLNALRAGGLSADRALLEDFFQRDFSAHQHLAVYGSLAPGRENHHHLSDLRGTWTAGLFVNGLLDESGWASGLGYPSLRWSPRGEPVPVQLFASAELPAHWPRLDDFEGIDYLRILVPVMRGGSILTVANLYAARA